MIYERELIKGELVRVHKNLNTGKWTVSAKIPGKSWQPVKSLDNITLHDASPIVSLSGVNRIRNKNSREVIAKIEGYYISNTSKTTDYSVHFNPFRSEDFTLENGTVYHNSNYAYFTSDCGHFYI